MRPHEIEAWVLEIIDRVESGQPVEDSRVELKAEWPAEHERAARRLAAHCNAARGSAVLWVVGLDENRGVVGASSADLPDWIARVRSHFVDLFPELVIDLSIPKNDLTVVALLFATERVPFVVRNPAFGQPNGGPVESEVPWREGTRVRSARREDLLRLLVPVCRLPLVHVLEASLACVKKVDGDPPASTRLSWQLRVRLYVTPQSPERVVIPFHQCRAALTIAPCIPSTPLEGIHLGPLVKTYRSVLDAPVFPTDLRLSRTVDATPHEVLIDGPGVVELHATRETDYVVGISGYPASYSFSLLPAGCHQTISDRGTLSAPHGEFGPKGVLSWK